MNTLQIINLIVIWLGVCGQAALLGWNFTHVYTQRKLHREVVYMLANEDREKEHKLHKALIAFRQLEFECDQRIKALEEKHWVQIKELQEALVKAKKSPGNESV